MPKRSSKDIQAEIDKLTAELQTSEDDDYEIWVKGDDGREYRFGGKDAKSIRSKFADLFETSDDSEEADEEEEPVEEDAKPAGGIWGRKK